METKNVVKYTSRDGQELTLSTDIIKKYLVSGRSEQVTDQEIMYFLGVCKSRGLNPFKKDCYLIKYGSEPAAIITSIDYFRSRARAQPDCKGWKKGIILQDKDGKVRDSLGLIMEGDTLIGGFFEARPDGWTEIFRLEVNLRGYIKKTKDGKTTRFWHPDNQPTMIAKVVEGQGLRTLWPDEFQGMYQDVEIQEPPVEIPKSDVSVTDSSDSATKLQDFLDSKAMSSETARSVEEFCRKSAEAASITLSELKHHASEDLGNFWVEFQKWHDKQKTTPETMPEIPPEPAGNWWDADRHWKFLKKDGFMQMVHLGIGADSSLEAADYPGAAGTLAEATEKTRKAVTAKYDKAAGEAGALKKMMLGTSRGEVEVDEDMEKIQAGILAESLEKIKKFPEYAVTAGRLNTRLKVGEMPSTVDEANELIDACKKFLFQNSQEDGR